MKTTRAISTISYNTLEYLVIKLKELQKAQKIAFWAFIMHKGESDDEVKNAKDHIHLYIEPAVSIQTEALREHFKEIDQNKAGYFLEQMPYSFSKFDDWYLYVIHDEDYLDSKGLSKQYHYNLDDVISSDENYLYYKIKQIDTSDLTPIRRLKQGIRLGLTFFQMVSKGWIPVGQVRQYEYAYNVLLYEIKDKREPEG